MTLTIGQLEVAAPQGAKQKGEYIFSLSHCNLAADVSTCSGADFNPQFSLCLLGFGARRQKCKKTKMQKTKDKSQK